MRGGGGQGDSRTQDRKLGASDPNSGACGCSEGTRPTPPRPGTHEASHQVPACTLLPWDSPFPAQARGTNLGKKVCDLSSALPQPTPQQDTVGSIWDRLPECPLPTKTGSAHSSRVHLSPGISTAISTCAGLYCHCHRDDVNTEKGLFPDRHSKQACKHHLPPNAKCGHCPLCAWRRPPGSGRRQTAGQEAGLPGRTPRRGPHAAGRLPLKRVYTHPATQARTMSVLNIRVYFYVHVHLSGVRDSMENRPLLCT